MHHSCRGARLPGGRARSGLTLRSTIMKSRASLPHGWGQGTFGLLLAPLVALAVAPAVHAQVAVVPLGNRPALERGPLVPPDLVFGPGPSLSGSASAPERIRL